MAGGRQSSTSFSFIKDSIMNNVMTPYKVYRYVIEPGDGTRYVFSFIPYLSEIPEAHPTLTGVSGRAVWLSIEMPSRTMTINMPYPAIQHMASSGRSDIVDYIHSKASYMDIYTICAVLLAISVLYNEPEAIEKAGKEMLRTPDILFPKDKH